MQKDKRAKNAKQKHSTESGGIRDRLHAMRALLRDENKLLLIALVCVVVAILIINTLYVTSHHTVTIETNDAQATRYVYTSQQLARTPEYSVRVHSVFQDGTEDRAFPLNTGETMLVLTIEITNNTPNAYDFYPANQLFIRDQEGGTYAPHASSRITEALPAGPVQAGQTVSGQISFAVPARITKPLLYVDLGWQNTAPVVFDVLR